MFKSRRTTKNGLSSDAGRKRSYYQGVKLHGKISCPVYNTDKVKIVAWTVKGKRYYSNVVRSHHQQESEAKHRD